MNRKNHEKYPYPFPISKTTTIWVFHEMGKDYGFHGDFFNLVVDRTGIYIALECRMGMYITCKFIWMYRQLRMIYSSNMVYIYTVYNII